jgi:hypothetical protein
MGSLLHIASPSIYYWLSPLLGVAQTLLSYIRQLWVSLSNVGAYRNTLWQVVKCGLDIWQNSVCRFRDRYVVSLASECTEKK